MSSSIYDIPVRTIEGADTSLAQFKGKVVIEPLPLGVWVDESGRGR